MDRECILGRMEGNMKALMKMIRSMDLEFIYGQMVASMKGTGKMENSMEMASLFKGKKEGREYGKKEKELNGLQIVILIVRILKNEIFIKN